MRTLRQAVVLHPLKNFIFGRVAQLGVHPGKFYAPQSLMRTLRQADVLHPLKNFIFGRVAQLGERTVRIRKVEGSIPFVSTT